jgi:hypothetical protein
VCVCVCVCDLTTIFLAGGLGVEDQRNGLRDVSALLHVAYFCGIGPRLGSPDQNREQQIGGTRIAAPLNC